MLVVMFDEQIYWEIVDIVSQYDTVIHDRSYADQSIILILHPNVWEILATLIAHLTVKGYTEIREPAQFGNGALMVTSHFKPPVI